MIVVSTSWRWRSEFTSGRARRGLPARTDVSATIISQNPLSHACGACAVVFRLEGRRGHTARQPDYPASMLGLPICHKFLPGFVPPRSPPHRLHLSRPWSPPETRKFPASVLGPVQATFWIQTGGEPAKEL